MVRRMIIMLVLVGIAFGGIFGFQTFKARMIAKALDELKSTPQAVSTTTAKVEDWQPRLEAVGSLRAVNGADLALQISGIVKEIHFQSGDVVAAGAPLLDLVADDNIARLHALEATADLAKITYQRDKDLVSRQAASQSTLDTDTANLKSAQAQVAQQQALLAQQSLHAPFAGRLGIRAVDVGQFLAAGTTVVTLQALDPIYADFYLPQQALNRIKLGQPVAAKVDTFPKESFAGEIAAINPKIDPSSRNVEVRAVLKNPDQKLLPGMFVTVDINVGTTQRYVTLPQTAIAFNSYGDTVYLVDAKEDGGGRRLLTARQVFVTTGDSRGDQIAVLTGVAEGDTIATAGQLKLHNGSPVVVENSVEPLAEANPTPTAEQ